MYVAVSNSLLMRRKYGLVINQFTNCLHFYVVCHSNILLNYYVLRLSIGSHGYVYYAQRLNNL